jgi:hypothetical protein
MHVRSLGLAALAAIFSTLVPGCQSEDEACPRVTGFFEAQYAWVDGNCSPTFDPLPVDFSAGEGGVTHSTMYRVNDKIETEVIMKGCTLRMSQSLIDREDTRLADIEGESLVIESASELSGVVYRREYDNQGQTVCQGIYDALYTKNTVTIAAAALD